MFCQYCGTRIEPDISNSLRLCKDCQEDFDSGKLKLDEDISR